MKEYQIIKALNTKEAQKLMNDMSEQGWEVVCMTGWQNTVSLLITFAKEKE